MPKSTQRTLLDRDYSNAYLVYTRKSTDDTDNQKNSIEYQVQEALKYAFKENLLVAPISIESFSEEGIIKEHHSGFKQKEDFIILSDGSIKQKVERPKFLYLADMLQKGNVKGVICLCWDRISRNEADDVIIKKLIKAGVDFRFVQANYENTSAGALHMDIDGMFSRHYSRVISEKVKNTATKLRKEGRCIYISPIGYLDKGSDSKPFDNERAPIVKKIFELYATGEWSYTTLAAWANQQGLTTKPVRRKRTRKEKLQGIPIESMPKLSRPVSAKTIENILNNPFYIGKNINEGQWIDSIAHEPLIDAGLFLKVRYMQSQRTTTVRYPHLEFATYRGLIKCKKCGRGFSPYVQRGITYYRTKCKPNCSSAVKNVSEKYITDEIQKILLKISLSDEEIAHVSVMAEAELAKVTQRRNSELEDLHGRLKKVMADLDYLLKERITLLRTGIMTVEILTTEEVRIRKEIDDIQSKIQANSVSSKAMLDYVISFSKLVENKGAYFQYALDAEKRDLSIKAFTELFFMDGQLEFTAKEGFEALFARYYDPVWSSGSPDYLFSNIEAIYQKAIKSKID
ncbi:MAG: hypothetical protein F9K23_09755 [Bacteroidetes bacterium]|nr:MAG: hypothetical protein F9K23_09755 [Bacteroidota bacterium]